MGGSVLLAMEWARTHGHRGLVASWPHFGVPVDYSCLNLAILAFSHWSGDQFVTWGWRIPFRIFLLSCLHRFGFCLGILETPVFKKLPHTNRIERAPIRSRQKQPREIILSGSLRMAEQAPFYIFTAFIFAYAVGTLHMSRDFVLTAVLVASCVSFITIPGAQATSPIASDAEDVPDRGRDSRPDPPSWSLGVIHTAIPALAFIAIVLSLIPHDMQYGPQAALIAEAFTPRLRYSGASFGLSACVDHRRRTGATDRDRAIRRLPYGLRDLRSTSRLAPS